MNNFATQITGSASNLLPFETFDTVDNNHNHTEGHVVKRINNELREITTLYNIGVALNSSLNSKEVIWALYKETSRLVDTSNFGLVIFDHYNQALNFMLVFDRGQRLNPFSVKLGNEPDLAGYVLSTQSPILVKDLGRSNRQFEVIRQYPDKQIGSWVGVPIINPVLPNETAQGAIMLWNRQPDAFTNHHVWLLSAIGTQASIAIRNARLFESSQRKAMEMSRLKDSATERVQEMETLKEQAQRKAEEMAFLNDVARTLSASLNLEKVLTTIMERVEDLLDVEAGSLLLTDITTGDLVFQIALGEKADQVKPFRVPKGQGIAGQVAQLGKPLITADAGQDERHFKALDEKTHFHTRNMLTVPLILHDQTIGVLQVLNKKGGNFNQNDVDLLRSISSYAAIAIENARLYQSLESEHNKTIEAELEARKELARDLHDGPTQLVAAIQMNLDFAKKALERDPSLLPGAIDEMYDLAARASHQMRTLLFELRPLVLESEGLGAALQVFLERRQKDITEDQNTKLTLKIETNNPGGDISRQDGKVEATIFAIVQEVVNNAVKHAQADSIIVELKETAEGIGTIITDDGKGFDLDEVMRNYETRGSLGMINLRERTESVGGEFTMESKIGEGTYTSIFIPNEKAEQDKFKKKRVTTGMLTLPPNMPPVNGISE